LIICGYRSTLSLDNNTPPNLVWIGGTSSLYDVTVPDCEPNTTRCESSGEEGDTCPQCRGADPDLIAI
jgi:hypothetical protein